MDFDHSLFVDTAELATLLHVSEWWLRVRRTKSWTGEAGPPWTKFAGRTLYKRAEVLAWIEAKTQTANRHPDAAKALQRPPPMRPAPRV